LWLGDFFRDEDYRYDVGGVTHTNKQQPKKDEAICSFAEFAIPVD
jgi:hypothetical protein